MNLDFLVWDFQMLFNMISILPCNRYDSCFNAVTHIYNVTHLRSCFLRRSVWSHLFDKRFCRISAVMQSFAEKIYICLGFSWFGNVMACTVFQNEGQRTAPLFYQTPFPLNSENCPQSLKKSNFLVNFHNKVKIN